MPSLAERVRMALAEAGYPDVIIMDDAPHPPYMDSCPHVSLSGPRSVTPEICWKAFVVAGTPNMPCFKCWNDGQGEECGDGNCCNAT